MVSISALIKINVPLSLIMWMSSNTSSLTPTGFAVIQWVFAMKVRNEHDDPHLSFSCTHTLSKGALALEAAHTVGMNIYLGMWVDRPDTFDSEFGALKALVASGASFSNVDAVIVGSEVIYRKEATPEMLASYIRQVRDLMNPLGVKVTTSEVFYDFSPPIVEAADFLMM